MITDITPTGNIDWDSQGKRLYHVPFTSDNEWARTRVPLCVACGPQSGKTVVAIGGTHGDEYEGPVGLKNLIRELKEKQKSDGHFDGNYGAPVATSMSLLALALNFRFLPIYER